jgi:hypothetical protein
MGDKDRGVAGLPLQVLQLTSGLFALGRVEMGQWLIEQQNRRLAHNCPGQADSLFLPAREAARFAVEQRRDAKTLRNLTRALVGIRLLPRPHAEGDVLLHRQRWKERVILEGDGNVALVRWERHDRAPRNSNIAGGWLLEARDHAQGRRFTAT